MGVRRHRETAPVITWLKADDIGKQLQVLDGTPTLHAMVATLIFAGLRREEAMWLTRADVDLDRRLLRVRAKTIRGDSWQPKTGRNRVVPIGDALLAVLRTYEAPANRSWFFLSPNGMRREMASYVSWFAEHRTHQELDGMTPNEVYDGSPTCEVAPQGEKTRREVVIRYHEGRRQLPIVDLRRAA